MAFTTRKSLLAKVRSGDEVSWSEFYVAYRPLILLCGGDCNLSCNENEELVQQVMTEIFQKDILSKYDIDQVPENIVFKHDPARGRFRHFLKKVIRNQAQKIYHNRRSNISLEQTGEISDDDQWEAAWNEEWQRHLLNMALIELRARIQADTFVAFEMYAIHNRPVKEVAEFLNFTVSGVYTAKSRCLATLKEIIHDMEDK